MTGANVAHADLAAQAADRLARRIERAARALGTSVALDGPALLRERADLEGLPPAGATTSPGGSCHLLPCVDGWVAVNLARPADLDLLPAWLALADAPAPAASARPASTPDELRPLVEPCAGAALAEAAALLGLPVGVLGEVDLEECDAEDGAHDGTRVVDLGPASAPGELRVLDLSALWAGPLCTRVLGLAGARVTTVESTSRPDASRAGSPELFARLREGKRAIAVDLGADEGVAALRAVIHRSDVVVESSRPRALEQLGIVAVDELARPGGPSWWVSITGHGRSSPRVAFGDDAAVAGGLVAWIDGEPRFAGDAPSDPLAGLTAAAACLEAIAGGRRALIDVPLAAVAAAATRAAGATATSAP